MSDVERWEVSWDGENWRPWLKGDIPKPGEVDRNGGFRYLRKAEPSQPVIGHVTPLTEVKVTTVEQLADELRGEAKARAAFVQGHPPDHILQFFSADHLSGGLKDVSLQFGMLAAWIVDNLPRNPERTVALRKLLEAKDAAVRAAIAK